MTRIPRSWTPAQRWLVGLGLVTGLSGLAHVMVWLAAGQPSLVGPVTWRKPIVFGLSIAVLAFSLAWVVRVLPDRRSLTRQARWLTILLIVELLLIDMQQWRGVGSHFNVATRFDAAVFQAMGMVIVTAAGLLAWWTWLVWRTPRPEVPAEAVTAARAGMLLLGVGNLIGIALAVWGSSVVAVTGAAPVALGQAGNLKLTHAVALHALQVLPLTALVLSALPEPAARVRRMRLAATGYAGLLVVTLWQALQGRAPADLGPAPALLAVLSAGALLAAVAAALRIRLSHRQAAGAAIGGS